MKSILFSILIGALCIQSCETDIPVEDLTPPSYEFRITGDGYDQRFDQDFDPAGKLLKLRYDVSYRFFFSTYDEGGVLRTSLNVAAEKVNITLDTDPISQSWEIFNQEEYVNIISWLDPRNTPISLTACSGQMTFKKDSTITGVQGFITNIYFDTSDYGGVVEDRNSTHGELPIFLLTEHEKTELTTY